MPAQPVTLEPVPPVLTRTMTPQLVRGFEIRCQITQTSATSDWRLNFTTTVPDPSVVDVNDRTFQLGGRNPLIPFNEAPTVEALLVKLQAEVDNIADNLIPRPATP